MLSSAPTASVTDKELMRLLTEFQLDASSSDCLIETPFYSAFKGLHSEFISQVEKSLVTPEDIVEPGVIHGLAEELTAILSDRCAFVIYGALQEFTGQIRPRGEEFTSPTENELSTYIEFIEFLRSEGWARIFDRNPVALDIIARTYSAFLASTIELLKRYKRDRTRIEEFFNIAVRYRIRSVSQSMSDPHDTGRVVRILKFSDGSQIVYKPRSMMGERIFNHVLDYAKSHGQLHRARSVIILDLETHGWMEFVHEEECATEDDVLAYFSICGEILALLYVLGASDMHEENLIATSLGPVPVDLECLLQPVIETKVNPTGEAAWAEKVESEISQSALRVGFIESHRQSNAATRVLVGALLYPETVKAKRVTWKNQGRSILFPVLDEFLQVQASALPITAGKRVSIVGREKVFLAGFAAVCAFCHRSRQDLITLVEGILREGSGELRLVLRPTQYYGLLRNRLLDHRRWGDRASWSNTADHPAGVRGPFSDAKSNLALVETEIKSLLQLDFPRFSFSNRSLLDDQKESSNLTAEEARILSLGLRQLHTRLEELCDSEVNTQCATLRRAILSSPTYIKSRPAFSHPWRGGGRSTEANSTSSKACFLSEASRILGLVEASAIEDGESLHWKGLGVEFGASANSLSAVGPGIYDGNLGVGLFAAAHAAVHRTDNSLELCIRALRPVLEFLKGNPSVAWNMLGLGALSGIGGVLCSLCSISKYAQRPDLLEFAINLVRSCEDQRLATRHVLDFAGGEMGYLWGLTKLFAATGDSTVKKQAMHVSRVLLQALDSDRDLNGGQFERRHLCGASHGLSGMALVLRSAASHFQILEFEQYSERCLKIEHSLYDPVTSCWPDRRSVDWKVGQTSAARWCHGAAGIGLARLELIKLGASVSWVRDDLLAALSIVIREDVLTNDSLCCGNFGSILFLNEVGGLEEFHGALGLSSSRALSRIEAAGMLGGYQWPAGEDVDNVGLYTGLSGVGMGLLHLASPELCGNPLTMYEPRMHELR